MNTIEFLKKHIISLFRISKVKNVSNSINVFENSSSIGTRDFSSLKVPKIIWSYWENDKISPTVEACISQLKKIHPTFEIHVLNQNSLQEFLPDFPSFPPQLPLANKTDLIRLMLLEKYGGVWTDASIIFNISIEEYINLDDFNVDLFAFSDHCEKNQVVPIIESWFLVAPPQSFFIAKWLDVLMKCFYSENPTAYFKKRPDFKDLTSHYSHLADYWLVYTAAQVALKELPSHSFKIQLFDSAFSAQFYSHYCGWSSMHIAKFLLLNKYKDVGVNMVKLTGEMRKCTDNLIERGIFRKDSYFGRFLK